MISPFRGTRLFPAPRPRPAGVVLVVVLAFVALLTILVVAFFSRSIDERQIANTSANQAQVQTLAQGATATIIGDLQQEIAAGSRLIPTIPASSTTIYAPLNPVNAAPALVGTTAAVGSGLENLLKRSANGQPFYPVTNYDANASNRAAALASDAPSLNGRFVSPARWNKPLLMPATSLPPSPTANFTVPDWVFVARNGTNPTAWNSNLTVSPNNATSVVGRYAYTVYNEGGLLDVNAAGFPKVPATGMAATVADYPGYKKTLAFADLTQIPGINDAVVNALAGWRDYATSGIDYTQSPPARDLPAVTGVFPAYTWSAKQTTHYFNFVNLTTTGFTRAANPLVVNGQTDRQFSSRQQLINMFTTGLTSLNNPTSLQSALQYLGTFSRGLEQPSYAPDPARPRVLNASLGGNNATGLDDPINLPLLGVRVVAAFTRDDGSQAVVGEPLMKKRFALRHLDELSYTKTATADPNNSIYRHFGLTRSTVSDHWTYNHGGSTQILHLDDVAKQGREPDFFEVLKAAVCVGSIGKIANMGPNTGSYMDYQYNRDSSVDGQIIQMGANIIDQWDSDGFPTRIYFNDTQTQQEYRGVENLPYFYRIHDSGALVTAPIPAPTAANPTCAPEAGTSATIKNPGLAITWLQPEIWNPHTWDPNNVDRSMGDHRPSEFRIIARSTRPSAEGPDSGLFMRVSRSVGQYAGKTAEVSNVPVLPSPPTGYSLNDAPRGDGKSELLFTIPTTRPDLFREPTLLNKPKLPDGSKLRIGGQNELNDTSLFTLTTSGGINILVNSDLYPTTMAEPAYLGMVNALSPVRWFDGGSIYTIDTVENTPVNTNGGSDRATADLILYYLDESGNWEPYDERYGAYIADLPQFYIKYNVLQRPRRVINPSDTHTAHDPRTSRFMMPGGSSASGYEFPPSETPTNGDTNQFMLATENITKTNRPEVLAGFGSQGGLTGDNSQPSPAYGWYPSTLNTASEFVRPGLYSQNSPNTPNDGLRYSSPVVDPKGVKYSDGPQYYADADGVIRRAMGAYVPVTTTATTTTLGLPLATATTFGASGVGKQDVTYGPGEDKGVSRPIMLNRAFNSVAELGYVFSGTPWKNIDFFTPESGDSALLDAFCIDAPDDPGGMVGGKVDLNTRQVPVLQAVLNNAYKDEFGLNSNQVTGETLKLAQALVTRTTTGPAAGPNKGAPQPLSNVGDLVGRWVSAVTAKGGGIDGSLSYDGFSGDLSKIYETPAPPATNNTADQAAYNIQRYREAAVRALSASGNARVWNVMIDVVAQTGRFPQTATAFNKFLVEGEQRYWVHLAIDRATGQVIDKSVEEVKE